MDSQKKKSPYCAALKKKRRNLNTMLLRRIYNYDTKCAFIHEWDEIRSKIRLLLIILSIFLQLTILISLKIGLVTSSAFICNRLLFSDPVLLSNGNLMKEGDPNVVSRPSAKKNRFYNLLLNLI